MFKKTWRNYITSGLKADQPSANLQKIILVNTFSLAGTTSLILFGCVHLSQGHKTSGLFELLCGIASFINIFLLRHSKNVKIASRIILVIMIAVLTFLTVTGGLKSTGSYWVFTFPALAFFLKGKRNGMLWVAFLYAMVIGAILLYNFNILPTIAYSLFNLRQLLVVLFVVSLLVYFYEYVRDKNETLITAQNEQLSSQNDQLSNEIEQRREAENKLKEALEAVEAANQIKTRFFSNVSHEIRTPLTLILTPLERILAGEHGEFSTTLRDKLESMVGNTHRLLRHVNQLLDFSRIESGAAAVTYEPKNILSMVGAVVQAFEPFARSKGVHLEQRSQGDLPQEVYVDANKLDKVLCNLLSNACKFTTDGGHIIVKLMQKQEWMVISVIDNGIGISAEDIEKLFDRFYQVENSSSRRYEGSGIGLSLSKELVELMGGKLTVESEIQVGSTFSVHLPVGTAHIKDARQVSRGDNKDTMQTNAEMAVNALAAETRRAKKSFGIKQSRSSISQVPFIETDSSTKEASLSKAISARAEIAEIKKGEEQDSDTRPLVLVVEDNLDMAALIMEICEHDYRVLHAEDGQQGLHMAVQYFPDLVISDVMMPVMDGYEMLSRIRQNSQMATLPVILLTAKASHEKKLDSLESGADDYLAKPFEARELAARVKNLIKMRQYERKLEEINTGLERKIIQQSTIIERSRRLHQYLPPQIVKQMLENYKDDAPQRQRTYVTVFRVELRGFETLSMNLDPEDFVAVINVYLSTVIEVAFAYGATLDRFVQDMVIGFFGAPTSMGRDEDACQCVKMLLELHKQIFSLRQNWAGIIDVNSPVPAIAVCSGYATVGNFGSAYRMEYTAIGGVMDESKYILLDTSPGEVLCSRRTLTHIHKNFPSEPRGEIRLPARSVPMKVYRLASQLADSTDATASGHDIPKQSGGHLVEARDVKEAIKQFTSDKITPGVVINDRYQINRILGRGGIGTVFMAYDNKLEMDVALKVLRNDIALDERYLKNLYREVRIARLVNHHNVARIFDLREWAGMEFLTMEYIEGISLKEILKSRGRFDIEEGVKILEQVCSGLGAAHLAGIIHRDLNPANIMLESNGRAVILDFGIAKTIFSKSASENEGGLGTPHYMAPEQFVSTEEVDYRVDIYALGVMAFEMFIGTKPFDSADLIKLAFDHVHTTPPNPLSLRLDLPPRIAALILRCLEKNPQDRFSSTTDFVTHLMVA